MNPSEIHQRTHTLEDEFTSIVQTINLEGGIESKRETNTHQYKYHIDDPQAYKDRLEELGAILSPDSPIEETDHYFLYPNESPGLDADTLCWREEVGFTDYHNDSPEERITRGTLVIKNGSGTNDPNARRHVQYATVSDVEAQYRVLEKINEIRDGQDFAPYRVSKKRTTYLLRLLNGEQAIVNLDEQVELSDEASGFVPYAIGDFLKIKLPDNSTYMIDDLRESLGLSGDSIDVPYIAKSDFLKRLYSSSVNRLPSEETSPENSWSTSAHGPYYYDAHTNTFVRDIDPMKLKGFDAHEKSQIKKQIEEICAELDRTDGGNDLLSRSSGGGRSSSTYERLTDHDGFIKYPSIRASLDSATLWRKRWQPSDRRIVFSRVAFQDDSKTGGIFIHYIGDHEGYERWLRQH